MLCPSCKKDTVQGYLKSSRNVYFGSEKSTEYSFEEKEIALGNFWKATDISCYHCTQCNLFFFYQPDQKNDEESIHNK